MQKTDSSPTKKQDFIPLIFHKVYDSYGGELTQEEVDEVRKKKIQEIFLTITRSLEQRSTKVIKTEDSHVIQYIDHLPRLPHTAPIQLAKHSAPHESLKSLEICPCPPQQGALLFQLPPTRVTPLKG